MLDMAGKPATSWDSTTRMAEGERGGWGGGIGV